VRIQRNQTQKRREKMSHEVTTYTDDTHSMIVTEGERAGWHRKHQWTEADTPVEAGFAAAKLDQLSYEKVQAKVTLLREDGVETVDIPDKFAVAYTHPETGRKHVLPGVAVGSRFHVSQPMRIAETAELFRQALDCSGYLAGAINGFARIFVSLAQPSRPVAVPGGTEMHQPYLLIADANDGSQSLLIGPYRMRIECSNTFDFVLPGLAQTSWRIRHTASLEDKLQKVEAAITGIDRYQSRLDSMLEQLLETPASVNDALEAFKVVRPPKYIGRDQKTTGKKKGDISTAWENDMANMISRTKREMEAVGPNRYATLQGLTGWAEHGRKVRGGAVARAEQSVPGGELTKLNQQFFNAATADLLTV